MINRERVTELAAKLRDAAKLNEPIAMAAVELIKLTLDETKESLVDAVGDDMLRKQGVAQELKRLHRELTVAPPNIKAGAT